MTNQRWMGLVGVAVLLGGAFGAGSAEERMLKPALAMHDELEKAGIKNAFYQSPGTAHEWQTWRRDLHEFAPLLFR